jgi:hypothetical protein
LHRRRPRIRRREPEHGVGTGKCLVYVGGIAVRPSHDLDTIVCSGRESGRISRNDAEGFSGVEQVLEDLAADQSGGGGYDDHVDLPKLLVWLSATSAIAKNG